jgi:sensor c-di-GMP phosphodiesterase-like protein
MASLVEGIEQDAQVSVLQAIGCRFGQGFLFSKPVPADRLLACMRAGPDGRRPGGRRPSMAMIENVRGLMPRKVS